ncbi:uncharacterized protein RCO7_09134 [Rhynchosporium graminicola]|uniref:Major facilitator superfamily (MFS) profile domain-containing protein n=1 Tax=Rhynchosporium graminicola TaxID=2792576 RepID=A0A1E1KL70_9HELO|nr:uncharacterized protein RCO7_09134 [Rhynchosporium commune]
MSFDKRPEDPATAEKLVLPLARTSIPYTTLSVRYRWYLTYLLGYLCLASSLTANIYFPLITLLAAHYLTSVQSINLTITLYILIQGIAPSIFSPLSNSFCRRPVYIFSFAIYTAASIGLAFSGDSYIALLLLRALQSMGGSAPLSLAYAVVADYARHSERVRFLGPMMTATNVGPSIGPVIRGGAILATGDPRWAFWSLVIFGGSALTLITFTMRETNRSIVGNGAVHPLGIWRTRSDILMAKHVSQNKDVTQDEPHPRDDAQTQQRGNPTEKDVEKVARPALAETGEDANHGHDINHGKTGRGVLTVPNPFKCLRILLYKDAFTVLYLAASPYASWYTITTSIPMIYGVEYGYNDLIIGCCYLAGGTGILAGGFIAGHLMDWNYKHAAKEAGLLIDQVAGDDIRSFPIERARSRGSYTIISVSALGFIGYGWAIQRHVHPAVPLVLQVYLGCKSTVIHQVYSALLVDIFPDSPGTAGASNNICRCVVSAVAVAVLKPVVDAIGRSWFFTLIGLLDGFGSVVAIYVLRRWGPIWREERLSRELSR